MPLSKTAFFSFFILLFTSKAFAQPRAGDIQVNFNEGYLSGSQIGAKMNYFDVEDCYMKNSGTGPAWSASVNYYVSPAVAIGAVFGDQWLSDNFTNLGEHVGERSYQLRTRITVAALQVKVLYDAESNFEYYGLYSLGMRTLSGSDSLLHFVHMRHQMQAIQITPFGYKVGGKVGFFVELGWGYKGILSAGLSYSFHSRAERKAQKADAGTQGGS